MDKEVGGFGAGLSWSAVAAGALVGLGLNFLLNLFTLAIGLTIFSYDTADKVIFSVLGFSNFIIVAIIAMFSTGWVAGILTPPTWPTQRWGILAGFLAWCLSLVVTTILLTNMIQFAAFHSDFTSQPNLAGVRLSNDEPMKTELKPHESKTTTPLAAKVELSKKMITLNTFITFILFALGATASAVGGYIGYGQSLKWFRKKRTPS